MRATLAKVVRGPLVLIGPATVVILVGTPSIFFIPLLSTKLLFYTRADITLVQAARDLFHTDKFLWIVVVLFGMALPTLKAIASVSLWYFVELSQTTKYRALIGSISRLSMLDVLLLALFIVAFKGVGIGTIQIRYGMYLYTAVVLGSLLVSESIEYAIQTAISSYKANPNLPTHQSSPQRRLPVIRTFGAILLVFLLIGAYFVLKDGSTLVNAVAPATLSEILSNPKKFEGTTVTVHGTVIGSASVLGVGGYLLRDEGSEVYVVSSHGVPSPGSKVVVSGTFKQAVAVGPLQYDVIFEQ